MTMRPRTPAGGGGTRRPAPSAANTRPATPRAPAPASRRPSGGAGGFVYRPRSPEQMRKAAEPRSGGGYDSPFKRDYAIYKPVAGINHCRILPPTWANPEHYSYAVWVHGYIGPDNGSYVCMRKMFGKPCAACDEHQAARQSGDDEMAKRFAPKEQFVCWVLDRKGDDKTAPQLWKMSGRQDSEIAALTVDERTNELLFVDHPEEGYDITFTRTGQGDRTRYSAFKFDRRTSPLLANAKEVAEVLAYITEHPIPKTLLTYEPEYLRRILYGEAEEADPELDDAANGEEEEAAVEETDEGSEDEVAYGSKEEQPADDSGEYYDGTESDEGDEEQPAEDEEPADDEYAEETSVEEDPDPEPEPDVRPRRQQPRQPATRTVRSDEVTRVAPRPASRPAASPRQAPRGGGATRYNK